LRKRRSSSVVHAAVDQEAIRGRLADIFPGRLRCRGIARRFCFLAYRLRARGADRKGCRRSLALDLVERPQLQLPGRRLRIRADDHVLLDRREALHFDFNRRRAIAQVGK